MPERRYKGMPQSRIPVADGILHGHDAGDDIFHVQLKAYIVLVVLRGKRIESTVPVINPVDFAVFTVFATGFSELEGYAEDVAAVSSVV